MQAPDTELLERICSHDDAIAYRRLVDGHVDRAYALALRLLPVRSLAESLVEETLVGTWKCRRARPWEQLGFSLWLYREIVTQGISRCGLLPAYPHPVDAVFEMPAQHRAALTLIYFTDMDAGKVATVLGTTREATEDILAEGRRMFREHFVVVR